MEQEQTNEQPEKAWSILDQTIEIQEFDFLGF